MALKAGGGNQIGAKFWEASASIALFACSLVAEAEEASLCLISFPRLSVMLSQSHRHQAVVLQDGINAAM